MYIKSLLILRKIKQKNIDYQTKQIYTNISKIITKSGLALLKKLMINGENNVVKVGVVYEKFS